MLKSNRIAIRAVRERDLDEIFSLRSNVAFRGNHISPVFLSESVFKQKFRETGFLSKDEGCFLITDPEDRIIGNIGYSTVDYLDGYELWYIVFEVAHRGSGIMSEALQLTTRYFFSSHKINRLQLVIPSENIASKRVAEKCGFTLEGRLRGVFFNEGKNQDLFIYSFLREDLTTTQVTSLANLV